MIVDRLRPRAAKVAVGHQERRRSRTGRYVVLTIGTGVVTGVAALAGIPPFGSLQALLAPISQYLHPTPPSAPIQASTIFPPVPPVHRTVDVYDPPPAARAPNPPPKPPAASSPRPTASPSPPLRSSPSPTPPGGD